MTKTEYIKAFFAGLIFWVSFGALLWIIDAAFTPGGY